MRAAFALAVAVMATPAFAHWKSKFANTDPAIQKWYKEQTDTNGNSCCADADAHSYYGPYILNKDGSVTINTKNGRDVIPASKVLIGPNPTGHAVWWYDQGPWGHYDFCFAIGTLG